MRCPKIAIILINYNGLEDTLACVRSLSKIRYPNHQVYVIDNGSQIKPREAILEICPQAQVQENTQNLGFTGASNIGCRKALEEGAELVLLLNNDTEVDPGFLEPMVEAMMEDGSLGMVAPKIYFHAQDRVIWAYGGSVSRLTGRSPHIGVYQKDEGQYDHLFEVDRITGCAMLVRKEIFERVGYLDNRFFMYCEETDWCLRIRNAGYRLAVISSSIIWHRGHRASGRVGRPFIGYLLTRNQLLHLRKNSNYFLAGGAIACLWYFGSITLLLGKFYLRWFLRKDTQARDYARAVLRGFLDCWRGRWGPPPWLKDAFSTPEK